MGQDLERISRELGIKEKDSKNAFKVMNSLEEPKHERIVSAISSLQDNYGTDFIIFGGQTVNPELLGFRYMRKPTGDVDAVINEDGICNLYDHFRKSQNLFYIPQIQKLCFIYRGVPMIFALDFIHDWEIPSDFRSNSLIKELRDMPVKITPPEYTIMMKMRRAHEKRRVFGKDVLDVDNLLLAPYFKDDLENIDFDSLGDIVHSNMDPNYNVLEEFLDEVRNSESQLSKKERPLFRKVYEEFRDSLLKE